MTLTVLDPGLLTTVQDRGRHGYAHLGVPRAGALDAPAAALANRLVGNPVDAAVLETTMTGASVRFDRALTVAVTGARSEVRVGRSGGPLRRTRVAARPVPSSRWGRPGRASGRTSR